MRLAMERVGTGLGAQIDHATGELAPVGPEIVVLNLEFSDRVLRRNDDGQIYVADVKRLAVEVFGTLVPKRTTDLVITPAKCVLLLQLADESLMVNFSWLRRNYVVDYAIQQRSIKY